MRYCRRIIALAALTLLLTRPAHPDANAAHTMADGSLYLIVGADPRAGFNFPYILYRPAGIDHACAPYLLVEANNTGTSRSADDDLEKATSAATRTGLGNTVAKGLGIPLLMPVFPRPKVADGNLYTHALSRDTMLVASGPLRRIDLQLAEMIRNGRHRLADMGRPVRSKVLIDGFSASAMFGSRFVYLHPDLVEAATLGGVNGFLMLPIAQIRGKILDYPLGVADYQRLSGHAFDSAAYGTVKQFVYMGGKDSNDAVQFDDAYTPAERQLVFSEFGTTMLPDRWRAVQLVFNQSAIKVDFHNYPDIGHETNGEVHRDILAFLRSAIATAGGEGACHS